MESYTIVLEVKCDDCGAEAYWNAGGAEAMNLPSRVIAQMVGGGWWKRHGHTYCPKCIANHRSDRPSRLRPNEIRRLESGELTPVALARERGITKARIYQILRSHYGCPYSLVSPLKSCPDCGGTLQRGFRGRCPECARRAHLKYMMPRKCACGAVMTRAARKCRKCHIEGMFIYDRESFVRLYAKVPSARCLGRYFGMSGALPYQILKAAGVGLQWKQLRFSDDEIRSAIEELAHEGFPVPDGCRLANRVCEAPGAGIASGGPGDGP